MFNVQYEFLERLLEQQIDGELEFGLMLSLGKFEEDEPTMTARKLDTKICDLPSADQPCQGNI